MDCGSLVDCLGDFGGGFRVVDTSFAGGGRAVSTCRDVTLL